MEKEGPQRLAGCSFHENGHQLLCELGLISVHAMALHGLTAPYPPGEDKPTMAQHILNAHSYYWWRTDSGRHLFAFFC